MIWNQAGFRTVSPGMSPSRPAASRLTGLAALAAPALILAACDLGLGGAVEVDGSWQLERGSQRGAALPVPDGGAITLEVDGEDIGGRAACNLYGGSIEVNGNRITLRASEMTEMGCEEELMAAEAAYIAAIGAVDRAARADDRLVLTGPNVELRFTLIPRVPQADLVGTRWILDGLVSGDAVSSTLGEEATLELADDGSFTGSTGCRTFGGDYAVNGGQVTVTHLVQDDGACADELAGQDEHVLDVIGGGFAVAVDGDRLTLSASDGLGLTYRADD